MSVSDDQYYAAQAMIDAGAPILVCDWHRHRSGCKSPCTREIDQPRNWQKITAAECSLDGFRYGHHVLAMVSGHLADVVDEDPKNGGSLDNMPTFEFFGEVETPSGGRHRFVRPTGLSSVQGLKTDAGFVGDFKGGTADGGGRGLVYLPGSLRPHYGSKVYTWTTPLDLEALAGAEPDGDLQATLLSAGASWDRKPGTPAASRKAAERFLAEHSTMPVPECNYGRKAVAELLDASRETVPGDQVHGRHGWLVRSTLRLVELMRGGCAWAADWVAFEQRLDVIKPEGGTDALAVLAYAIANADGKSKCSLHTGSRPSSGARHVTPGNLPAEFWSESKVLGAVRQAAHHHQLSADAVLGASLARTALLTPYSVHLPSSPNYGALNLFVALVSDSGGGKTSAARLASDLLKIGTSGSFRFWAPATSCLCGDPEHPGDFLVVPAGSGEGLIKSFFSQVKEGRRTVTRRDRHHVLMAVDEVEVLFALGARTASTIEPVLRQLWSGVLAGFNNASDERKLILEPESYRLALVVGAQPSVLGRMFRAGTEGGSPQRFVLFTADDPTVPDLSAGEELPPMPDPLEAPPRDDKLSVVAVAEPVLREIRLNRNGQVRGAVRLGLLDRHRDFNRLRVAWHLGRMHLESGVSERWWHLAGMVMDASDEVRASTFEATSTVTVDEARRRGRLDAARDVGRSEAVAERVEKAAAVLARLVERHHESGGEWHKASEFCSRRCLSHAIGSRYRDVKDEAIEFAVSVSYVDEPESGRFAPGRAKPR